MSSITIEAPQTVRCPQAVAHLSAAAEPAPGAWLNEATRALAEAGVSVATLLDFRAQARRAGDVVVLLTIIATWMLVD